MHRRGRSRSPTRHPKDIGLTDTPDLFLVNEMSSRIDNLENSIQDLMQGGIEGGRGVASPTPVTAKRV